MDETISSTSPHRHNLYTITPAKAAASHTSNTRRCWIIGLGSDNACYMRTVAVLVIGQLTGISGVIPKLGISIPEIVNQIRVGITIVSHEVGSGIHHTDDYRRIAGFDIPC